MIFSLVAALGGARKVRKVWALGKTGERIAWEKRRHTARKILCEFNSLADMMQKIITVCPTAWSKTIKKSNFASKYITYISIFILLHFPHLFGGTIKRKFNINLAQNDEGRKKHIDNATRSSHASHPSINQSSLTAAVPTAKNLYIFIYTGDWRQVGQEEKKEVI